MKQETENINRNKEVCKKTLFKEYKANSSYKTALSKILSNINISSKPKWEPQSSVSTNNFWQYVNRG